MSDRTIPPRTPDSNYIMKNVAVTGASGLIGQQLLERLVADEAVEQVLVLDMRAPTLESPKIKFVAQDVSLPFEALFVKANIDAAFHLAFILNPIHDRERMRAVNLGGTRNFLMACERANVQDILVVSSGTAYGAHSDNPPILDENAPIRANQNFSYVADKGEMERICQDWMRRHPTVRLVTARPTMVLGPRVNNFISRSLIRRVFFKVRGHNPQLQFVHEEDVAALFYLLVKKQKSGPFNIAADGSLSVLEVARKVDAWVLDYPKWILSFVAGLAWQLRLGIVAEADPGVIDFVQWPWILDTTRVKQELGYQFKYTAEQTLDAAIQAQTQASRPPAS